MAKKNKKGLSIGKLMFIIFAGLASLAALIAIIINGKNIALFNPQGYIAQQQYNLMMFVTIVLFAVAIPVVFAAYFIAYKYRETNPNLKHISNHKHSKYMEARMWALPVAVMLLLAGVMIPATHRLAPQKTIASDTPVLKIQVISLRWKWLFLYPEQGIATVNFIQLPVDTPVEFEMTADETPMSSFWIPNLGGQLYTMTSHSNRLNLMATAPGDYPGSTPEINGIGFAGMKFTARAGSDDDFEQWVENVKRSPNNLDLETYQQLLKPSENNPVANYAGYYSDLYDKVISKYAGSAEGHQH